MERRRSSQVIAIVALLLAVGGLSLGFAAFSNTLTIRSNAEVKPVSDFNVDFQNPDGTTTALAGVASGATGATAGSATYDNSTDSPTIGGLKANFTQPGQTVTYTFRAANVNKVKAYLKSITYATVSGTDPASYKKCEANATSTTGTGVATPSLVASACESISMTVSVGGTPYSSSQTISDSTGLLPVDSNGDVVTGGSTPVVVTITYAADGARADGDFTVTFGDVSLVYSSVSA